MEVTATETGSEDETPALFATETMAELYVRQGKGRQALLIYRRLLLNAPAEREAQLRLRVAEIERRLRQSEPPRPAGQNAPAPAVGAPARPSPGQPAPARPREAVPTLVVTQAVRSGQVVHARGADLIVLAPVNPGAQVLADGHIHVYAPLRGFAVAGAGGRTDARLFCQRLEAEVVGIADVLVSADQLPAACRGQAAQVRLVDGRCVIDPL